MSNPVAAVQTEKELVGSTPKKLEEQINKSKPFGKVAIHWRLIRRKIVSFQSRDKGGTSRGENAKALADLLTDRVARVNQLHLYPKKKGNSKTVKFSAYEVTLSECRTKAIVHMKNLQAYGHVLSDSRFDFLDTPKANGNGMWMVPIPLSRIKTIDFA